MTLIDALYQIAQLLFTNDVISEIVINCGLLH